MEETKGFVSAKDALAALEQYQGCFFPHSAAVKIINQLSREDVEPVVHGRWIEYQIPHIMCCSECDWGTGVQSDFRYCPNCGAKMDKEKV
jgi:hypothetical protein